MPIQPAVLVSKAPSQPSPRRAPYAFVLLALVTALSASGCAKKACTVTADCGVGELCARNLGYCRKSCVQPIDCAGDTICSQLPSGQYACLEPGERTTQSPGGSTSTDTSLGAECVSPTNNGVSQPNEVLGACGDSAPLCTNAFGADPSFEIQTCTSECRNDAECGEKRPANCTGDCQSAYENLCCFPQQPIASAEQFTGKRTNAQGDVMPLYCRPRALCYLVPKRCTQDSDCARGRAGGVCNKTADGGGACISGKLGLYECCQRDGECDLAPGGDGSKAMSCQPSLDNLSGYCSRRCATDADCQAAGAPMGSSCWTTMYESTTFEGQCRVIDNPNPICRPYPKPVKPDPESKLVACDVGDRPMTLSDNRYDPSLRRCVRTF